MHPTLLHPISLTYSTMHIYPWQMHPPIPQSTIDPCYTVTPHKSHMLEHAHIPITDWLPCQSIIDACYTITPSSCQLTIDPCYTVTPHKSAQGICILCSMWNLWGCSGMPWIYCWLQEGWGQSIIKLIWYNGLPEIHAQLTRGVLLVWGYTLTENLT